MVTIFQSDMWTFPVSQLSNLNHKRTHKWNYCWKKKYGLKVIVQPVKTPYYAPFLDPIETINKLKRRYGYIHAAFPPFEGLVGRKYTFVGDLSKDFQFDHSLRKAIRKAEKTDHEFIIGGDLYDCYSLEMESYKRLGYNYSYGSAEKFINFVNIVQCIKTFSVNYEGVPVGYFQVVVDDHNGYAYAWTNVFDYGFQNTRLNQLMTVRVLEWLKEKGYHYFDFCGANIPSIAKYKEQYGFERKTYYTYTYKIFNLKR